MSIFKENKYTLVADGSTMFMDDSSGIKFMPEMHLMNARDESEYVVKTRLRWEHSNATKSEAEGRLALAGGPLSGKFSGSWPYYDFYIAKSDDVENELYSLKDTKARVANMPLPERYWFNLELFNGSKQVGEFVTNGQDTWQLESYNMSGEVAYKAETQSAWLGSLINWLYVLLPKDMVKQLPFDISDFLPITYSLKKGDREIATFKNKITLMKKTFEIEMQQGLDEEDSLQVLATASAMLFYVARNLPIPSENRKNMRREVKSNLS